MQDSPRHILIVEDEKPLAHALELKLQHEGMITKVAHNGQEGLALLQQEQFDIVLLDIMMPVMDGFQLLEQLANAEHRPIIFVLSNLTQPEDERRVMELGARKFFIKADTPLSLIIDEVKNAIRG